MSPPLDPPPNERAVWRNPALKRGSAESESSATQRFLRVLGAARAPGRLSTAALPCGTAVTVMSCAMIFNT
ncbi:hypothetical protein GN956_G11656 [Arapaima gigas]